MFVYRNSDSQTRSFGGIQHADGSGVTLKPGQQIAAATPIVAAWLAEVPAEQIEGTPPVVAAQLDPNAAQDTPEPAQIEQLPEGDFATREPIPGGVQNEDGSLTATGTGEETIGTEVPLGETGTVSNPPETPSQTAEELAAEVARLEAELAHQNDTPPPAPVDPSAEPTAPTPPA